MTRALAVTAAILSLAACATAGGRAGPEGSSPAARGESLYRAHCGSCHRLRDPAEQTRDGWARALERYGPRAHLDEAERPLVLEYLASRARDAAPGKEAP